ncbi:protein C-mannosyl-transferase DPY19L3-like [Oscarella lobularis]|uniref:protein C-mannosyl-transferase DPY19L3-like n=1 Tax=Oscarella lobularis TaxID=121494 RepID=UPI003313A123
MATVRRRRQDRKEVPTSKTDKKSVALIRNAAAEMLKRFLSSSILHFLVGATICVYLGAKWGMQMRQFHENDMFFSEIKEVEREISFRTEAGLYYSYYKELVQARTWTDGIYSLMYDNVTEHLRTVNIIERFNIHQEIILGTLYRVLPIQHLVEPVYFYIDTVFSLYGLYGMTLFGLSWLLSGTFLGGVVTLAFVFFNRGEVTRVYFTMALRESFAFPFIYIQLGLTALYLRYNVGSKTKWALLSAIFATTLAFVLFWQFAQFILLLQAFALFAVQLVGIASTKKIKNLFLIHVASLLIVCVLQFGNTMVLQSFVLSFITASLLVFAVQGSENIKVTSVLNGILKVVGYGCVTVILGFAIHSLAKFIVNADSDEHITNFVKAKFGILDPREMRDFDVLLYLCNEGFIFLPKFVLDNMWGTFLLPTYALVLLMGTLTLIVSVLVKWHSSSSNGDGPLLYARPDWSYLLVQTTLYGILALTTRRFIYLWAPSMCVVAGAGICNCTVWKWAWEKVKAHVVVGKICQYGIILAFIGLISYLCLPRLTNDLQQLREFWDPDTVELMEWIKNSTAPTASFAGSMQLLAGVKLCTGRHVTNHPHYENKWLRERTKKSGQIYARQSAAKVHAFMKEIDAHYIIVEDSICLSSPKPEQHCRFPDVIDIYNGHMPDEKVHADYAKGLKQTKTPRFCDEVRYLAPPYRKRFHLVMENRTFRVYEVLPQK